MEIKKYKLKGHESFILRDGWVTKALIAISKDNKLFTVNSGADALGVGTNMAKAIRYWMKTAGLVNDNSAKGVTLTKLGELIANNDLYLEDSFTLWLIHANIATNFEQATSWSVFFNHLELTSAFSREELFEMMKSLLVEYTGVTELSDRSIRDDCAAIVSMYSRSGSAGEDPEDKHNSPFDELGLIRQNGNKLVKKRPMADSIDPLLILYMIIDELNAAGSMQIDHLTESDNMPGKILNLNRILINEYLDKLKNKGYIVVNRTAGLDIIYPASCKEMTKEDVVKAYYK